LQLTSSGISGNAGSVVTVKMGKQINNQMLSRVYSPDYLNWVDIKAGALNDRSQEWVTFFTEKNNQRSVTLPAYLVEPVDSIYRLKPYGLSFNQNQKPVMQNLMFNDTLENIELLTLKSYQLAGSLTESEATIQNDLNEDDLLMPAETVLISTTLNAFANHFYTAGLNKIKPETFFIYSATSSIGLKALGSPTKNAEVFLGDQINSVRLTLNADINGVYDYQDYLPEGQYLIRFREYQLENSFKQTGPLSNVVFVRVDLTDPVLSQVKLDRTVFSDVYAGGQLSFYASELSTLKIILNGTQTISVNYTAVAGLNRIAFKVPTLNEGVYELTYQLTDPVNRISNTVTGSIQIDRTAPTQVKIVSPLSGSSAFAYTTLEYSAPQDGSGSGIQSLGLYQTFSGGDQLIANLNPTSPTAAVYLTADVSGSAQIKIKAVDFGGNITWSDVQLVTVLADSLTQISDQKLIPEFQDYVIKNLSSESGFGIPGMDVYVLTDLSQTAQINSMTPVAVLDAQGQLPVVSISVTPDVFYILAVTQNHFSNLVTVPNRLPHFEAPLIAGKMPAVSQVSMGQTLYEKNNVSVSAGDWVNKADVLKLSFVPVRSQRKYLAQTATIDSQLMLSLTATSSQMLIYQAQPNQVYYKKLNGDQVHFELLEANQKLKRQKLN
jgi:hypothetical protein